MEGLWVANLESDREINKKFVCLPPGQSLQTEELTQIGLLMITKAKNDKEFVAMYKAREKETGQKLPVVMAIMLKLNETYACK